MKHMLQHSFVLDALAQTAPTTFHHFEDLIEEHRLFDTTSSSNTGKTSKLQQLVPTVGEFHTSLPLERAFLYYDEKYSVTSRRHVTLSFNEIRQILNLSQVMALCGRVGTDDVGLSVDVGGKDVFSGPRIGERAILGA